MLLRSLTLDNVGVYRGPQKVRFAATKRRPITLIGGQNGTGKTTLLESIPLVLYGGRARQLFSGTSYTQHLNSLISHGECSASITIEFDMIKDGKQVRYVVERAWKRTNLGQPSDRLNVSTNDNPRPDLAASWPEHAERIMPMAVSGLAIFDGEKISSLADPVSSAEVLRTSLYGLLGLDLIEKLRSDLRNYRLRTAKARTGQPSEHLSEQLSEAERRLAKAIEERDAAAQTLANAESKRADIEIRFQTAEDKLAIAGGGFLAEREGIQRRLADANAQADATERELLLLAAGDLPITIVPDLLKQVASAGEQGEAFRVAQHLRSALSMRNGRLVEQLVAELGLGETEAETISAVLAADLESIEQPAPPNFLPTLESATAAREILQRHSNDLRTQAKRLTQQLDDLKSEAAIVEKMLEAAPDADKVASTIQQVAEAEAELRGADKHVEQARHAADGAERRAAQARREVDTLAHKVLNDGAAAERATRTAREIAATDELLAEFADHMVRNHLASITKEIDGALTTLLRKQKLATGVHIDPADLSVSLLDGQRQPINTRKPSAGERQMMATAVLWGLSRATGMTLPTVIDTPIGRLDKSHRMNIVARYFPNASRQVVLLSTDEEITGDYLERLRPRIGQAYTLDFDETDESTSILMGYFDE